ncbi:MAG: DUF1624 domain-containing protein [Clostridium sp.]|jgi:uncharacterized membrane protein|nr:DUF1624 domain-containing protein [Clostridium sp.]
MGKKDVLQKRVWEIDMLRGILVVFLIILHTIFDLEFFYNIPLGYNTGFIYIFGRIVATSFILISGISTVFSRNSFKRGMIVLSTALFVTLATYFFDNEYFVIFGILHLLGICIMVSPLLKKLSYTWLFILSILLALSYLVIPYVKTTHNFFFIFGIHNGEISSSDYYPILPWAWVFVLGIALGKILYREKKSIFKFSVKENPLNFLGRYSLWIYVIHQPVILLLLTVIMGQTP